MEIDHATTGCEQSRRDQLLLQEELSEQNRDLRETLFKRFHEMEELKRVQELRVDEFSRRRTIENQDTIHELTARIQELQNEVNCMNDSRVKDAESVRSGPSHIPSQPACFPPSRDPPGLISRNNQPPDIWNSQGISGNFLQIHERLLRHPIQEDSILGFPTKRKTQSVTCGERQIPDTVLTKRFQTDRQPEIHSTPVREDLQRIMGQTNKDCRFQILILTNSSHQQQLLVGRCDSKLRYVLAHNFLLKLCNGSKKWIWLNQWMI